MTKYSIKTWINQYKAIFALFWKLVMLGMFVAGPLLVVYQAFQWLKTGAWPDIDVYAWWAWQGNDPAPHVDWVGLQKIVHFFLSLPLWLVCPSIGTVMLWISYKWGTIKESAHISD